MGKRKRGPGGRNEWRKREIEVEREPILVTVGDVLSGRVCVECYAPATHTARCYEHADEVLGICDNCCADPSCPRKRRKGWEFSPGRFADVAARAVASFE